MTDAWEMHPETGLNPGPVWRDRGIIINTLTRDKQALEQRVGELELAALNLRDAYQGAHEREQALRASLQRVVDEWAAHFAEFGITNEWDQGANDVYNELAVILTSADAFRGAVSPAVDATPEPTPTDEARCRVCGGTGGQHDGATHDARVADMPPRPASPVVAPSATDKKCWRHDYGHGEYECRRPAPVADPDTTNQNTGGER